MGSIILNLFIVDPWTTWVWTMKVHLYADFCQEIYSRLSVSTGSTPMEKEGQLWDFASLGTWGGFWNQSPKIPPRDDCIYLIKLSVTNQSSVTTATTTLITWLPFLSHLDCDNPCQVTQHMNTCPYLACILTPDMRKPFYIVTVLVLADLQILLWASFY